MTEEWTEGRFKFHRPIKDLPSPTPHFPVIKLARKRFSRGKRVARPCFVSQTEAANFLSIGLRSASERERMPLLEVIQSTTSRTALCTD